ncbi:MAG: hypothetical protein RSE00_06035 [Clostridia bacterium]
MDKLLYLLVLWKDTVIGKVYKNSKEEFLYFPDYEKIFFASKELGMPKFLVMQPQINWGELPQFIKKRIELDPEFTVDCKLSTDEFTIKRK